MLTRRAVVMGIAMGAGAASSWPRDSGPKDLGPKDLDSHAKDWTWLVGNWDVWHRRLKQRLAGSNDWQEFGGKSAMWLSMNGLGTIDDNIIELPGDTYRGMTLRAFDPTTRQWSIWWLDGRNPTRIDPPVMGRFQADSGTFVGRDEFQGRPIVMRFRWLDIHSQRPHWEQAFSPDDGATWEVNWRNYFTRTSPNPAPLPRLEGAPRDWNFLIGNWQVRNRRLKQRFGANPQWEEFDSTIDNWPVLGGFGNIGNNVFHAPGGSYYGMSIRAFDPEKRQWLSWWLDSRNPSTIAPPVRGEFKEAMGTLIGDDVFEGKPIRVRSQWSRVTPTSAHWEQAASKDGGVTWETNWIADLTRRA
jgi:hypothetical protein